jgi:hypothetical protein
VPELALTLNLTEPAENTEFSQQMAGFRLLTGKMREFQANGGWYLNYCCWKFALR